MPPKSVEDLFKDDRLFFSVFQYAAIGMALVDPDGNWLGVNRALCDLIGYSEEELLNLTFQDITHPDDQEQDLHYITQMLSGDLETYQMEKRYIHRDGSIIYILLDVSLVKDANASPLFFISQMQNITDRKLLENELVRQATEDMLTGISNRRRFYDLAEREILRGGRYNDPMVLLMLDIDHFKRINDTYGHATGDEALKQIATVCSAELRSFDIFGRIGGEEFSALLVKTDAVIGHQVAERLRRSVENHILATEKGVVKLSISVGGIAFSGNEHSLEYRLNQADQALYKAKSAGRNRTVLVDALALQERESAALRTGFVRLEWNKAYLCGNELIDEQHQNLFAQSNRLLTAMLAREESSICQQYIDELIHDVSDHFKAEERLIEQSAFPDVDGHKKLHQALVTTAITVSKRHKKGQLKVAEVFNYLAVQVVSQHLLNEDQKFFPYLQKDKSRNKKCDRV